MFTCARLQRRFLSRCAVLIEHDGKAPSAASLSALKFASDTLNKFSAVEKSIDAIVVTDPSCNEGLVGLLQSYPFGKIYHADGNYAHHLPEVLASTVAALHKEKKWEMLIAAHTSLGKGVWPRMAALVGESVEMASDVTGCDVEKDTNGLVFTRPIYAGEFVCHKHFS